VTLQQDYSNLPEWKLQRVKYRTRKRKAITSPVWQPHPDNAPQCQAYELAKSGDVMQMGYGGQAGGGKTDLGLGLAGTVFPDSLFLRREFPHLKKVIQRGNEIFPVRYVSGEKKMWIFDNHIITLGNMHRRDDWEIYQGQANSLIVFDEGAQFLEAQVRSLFGWQRTVVPNQHTLLLLNFNPPTTPEGEWIIKFFAPWIDPEYPGERAQDGEIRWFAMLDGVEEEVPSGDIFEHNEEMIYPVSRTFIAASRHDNPYLGEDYERALSNTPEPLRSMLMYGDFTLSAQDDRWQVIPTNWILAAMERGRNTPKPDVGLRAVGVDVAHGGNDCTAISKVYGVWFDELDIYPGHETPDGQTAAHFVIQSIGAATAPIFVDGVGYGASCADTLICMPGVQAYAINNGSSVKTTDKSGIYKFTNLRAASFWALREALDPESGENICLPDDRDLRVELAAMRYNIASGKIKIESKEDIIKRLGRSPDRADAVALAWHVVTSHYVPAIVG
jgi:hypothetical protein